MEHSKDGDPKERSSRGLGTVRVVIAGRSHSKPSEGFAAKEDDDLSRSPTGSSDAFISHLTSTGVSGERAVTLLKQLEQEFKRQAKGKHPNIFILDDTFRDTSPVPPPTLIPALRDARGLSRHIKVIPLSLEERFKLIRDITVALEFLHSRNPPIIHGDLKPSNIIVSPDGRALLCDFGLARHSSTPPALKSSKSTDAVTRYLSPEICIADRASKTLESDVWAWACTTFETLTGSAPYSAASGDGAILMAMIQGATPGNPDSLLRLKLRTGQQDYSSALMCTSAYIRDCWDFDSSKRPRIPGLRRQLFKFLEKASDTTMNALMLTMEDWRHLLVQPDRISIVEGVEFDADLYKNLVFAKLDETSSNPRDVTVKTFRAMTTSRDRACLAARLEIELKIWATLRHPNVLELIGYCPDDRYGLPQFISSFMINGNVTQYIGRVEPDLFVRLKFVQGLTDGLDYLHALRPAICHGGVIPANVLISDNQDAVLSHFENARFVEDSIPLPESATLDRPEASKRYTSPEILGEELAPRTPASDIWSWACTVFEILTNRTPYADERGDIRFYQAINQGKVPGDRDLLLRLASDACKSDCASGLRFLHSYIRLCWDFDPRKRPQISTFRQQLSYICARDASRNGLKLALDELAYLLVQPHRITIIEGSDLGAGNYGDVVLAKLDESSPTSRDVAVKQLRAVGTRGDRIRLVNVRLFWARVDGISSILGQRLVRELNIWAKIKHPNIVELIGYYLDENFEVPQLISAFMVNGNVLKYIRCAEPSTARRVQFECPACMALTNRYVMET
ncbi:hypothetical protein FS837_002031 [Tulasnella sp. UAMH 9824]|nr:hypothetical protein FS837_002031 [Tulasnella sp. UAMH 9824]